MRRLLAFSLFLFTAFCAGSPGAGTQGSPVPGRGAISIEIVPNPIQARHVSSTTYDFPFEVVVRETGGRPVVIRRVSAVVKALGGLEIARESYDAAKIQSLGYSTSVPAGGELRYRFSQRHSVPDERLFSGVSADLTVEGSDDGGAPVNARTTVTVRK